MLVTCATLAATLQSLTAAASIVVTGPCGPDVSLYAAPVGTTIDFTASPLVQLDVQNITGMTLKGILSNGAQSSAVNILHDSQILIVAPRINNPGTAGILIEDSDSIEVAGSWVEGSSGDGVEIGGASNINIHDGACDDAFAAGRHVCVLEWSATNYPLQHIVVQNMTAIGNTKGFILNDQQDYGATDVAFLSNHAAVEVGACITVSYAHQLVVRGNNCHTMPGATSAPIVMVTNSPGAVVSYNTNGADP